MLKVLRDSSSMIMHAAPLFPMAVGLIAGIAFDRSVQPGHLMYLYVMAAVSVAAIVRPIRASIGPVLVVAASACVGGAMHLGDARTVAASSIERYAAETKRIARIRGTVVSQPRVLGSSEHPFKRWTYGGDRTVFLLDVESIEGSNGDIAVTGRIRITIQEAILDLRENEHIELFGWLYQLRRPRNPGSFDWASFYRRQGVVAGMSCNLQENMHRSGRAPPPRHGRWLTWLRTTVRGMLTDDLATGGDEEASLLEAMVLGHRSALDRRLNEVFIRAGCIHFLAVSGTHVVVVVSLVWGLGRLLTLSKRRCTWLMMGAVVLYAVIAEPRPPILRATVVTLLFCVSLLLYRPRARLNWMSAAAIVLILSDVTTVFGAGFQLSFAAVVGVGYLTHPLLQLGAGWRWIIERLILRRPFAEMDRELVQSLPDSRSGSPAAGRIAHRALRRLLRSVVLLLAVSCAAWLAGAPIVAIHFQRLQPWGPVSSVIVFPLMSLVMVIGFAKLIIGAVSLTAGPLLACVLGAFSSLLIGVVEHLALLPGASAMLRGPAWWVVVSYYLFLLALVWRFPRPRSAKPPRRGDQQASGGHPHLAGWSCLVALAVLASTVTAWSWPRPPEGRLVVTVLSVGAGSATVIELPDGRTILYDAGTSSPYDVGRSTIVPFLRDRGIRRIERAYVSHPNLDHFSGLPTILDAVPTGPIIVNRYFEPGSTPTSASRHLLDLLKDRGHELRALDPSTRVWEIGGVRLEWLWPLGDWDESLSANETSTVLRLSYAGASILLTGDIEERGQAALLHAGDLRADVLLLPHHGSVRPISKEFVRAVGASAVIRSSHRRMDETFSDLRDVVEGIPLYNTADLGAVQAIIDRDGVHVSPLCRDGC